MSNFETSRRSRWRAAIAVLAAALVAGQGRSARAQADDQRQSYRISGSSAQVAPHMYLSGSYQIYVSAHNTPWSTHHKTCLFSATLDGEEHAVPARYVAWGVPMPILDIPYYKKQRVITFVPGHYQFHIFPQEDCAYTILVTPWDVDRVEGPLTFVAAKIFDEPGTQVERVRWGAKYDAAIYVAGGTKGATGELQVLQGDVVRAKVPLERAVAEDGGVYFHAWLQATDDGSQGVRDGPLTLRFVLVKPGERLSRDLVTELGK